ADELGVARREVGDRLPFDRRAGHDDEDVAQAYARQVLDKRSSEVSLADTGGEIGDNLASVAPRDLLDEHSKCILVGRAKVHDRRDLVDEVAVDGHRGHRTTPVEYSSCG